MTRKSTKTHFINSRGQRLSAILDMPSGAPLFHGVFAPCFTCTKDSHGAAKICRAMADRGAAMLRFDIAGIGESEGAFADMTFTSRVEDIVSACAAMAEMQAVPRLLVGHSIGGTAAIAAALRVPSLEVVATIGAPRDPRYVLEKFRRNNTITLKGDMAEVMVMGKPVLFNASFIADMESHDIEADTAALEQKLLVFHAPNDDVVSYENAKAIFDRATGDKELVTLDPLATHLFETRIKDAEYVAKKLIDVFN